MVNRLVSSQLSPGHFRFRFVLMGLFSVLSVASGTLVSEVAHAQPGDINKYTNIARQIEVKRMQDYAEVKKLMGGTVPENVCQRGDVPSRVKEICSRFDSNSRDIIQQNGMSIQEFNKLTRYCQQSPKPKECP